MHESGLKLSKEELNAAARNISKKTGGFFVVNGDCLAGKVIVGNEATPENVGEAYKKIAVVEILRNNFVYSVTDDLKPCLMIVKIENPHIIRSLSKNEFEYPEILEATKDLFNKKVNKHVAGLNQLRTNKKALAESQNEKLHQWGMPSLFWYNQEEDFIEITVDKVDSFHYQHFFGQKLIDKLDAELLSLYEELARECLNEAIKKSTNLDKKIDQDLLKSALKKELLECTPVSFALAEFLEETYLSNKTNKKTDEEIDKETDGQLVDIAEIVTSLKTEWKSSFCEAYVILEKVQTEWKIQLNNTHKKENSIEEDKVLTHKINAVSTILTKLASTQYDNVSLCQILEAGRESASILAKNRQILEEERHPMLRKALYIASVMLIPFGIGILTSVVCALHSKSHYGTFFFLKAAGERKTVGGVVATRSLQILAKTGIEPSTSDQSEDSSDTSSQSSEQTEGEDSSDTFSQTGSQYEDLSDRSEPIVPFF